MKRNNLPNPFELENLEERIMLSCDPLFAVADSIAPDNANLPDTGLEKPPLEETFSPGDDDPQHAAYQPSLEYDPSQNLTDIFSGLTEEAPLADQNGDTTPEEAPSLDEAFTEDTTMVNLSDHLITDVEQAAIIQGMDELANLGRMLEDVDAFGVPLPLIDATLGQLLGPYEVLDARLSKPVYKYFSDATDPPSVDGLLEALRGVPSTPDLNVTVNTKSGGYDNISDELRFDIDFKATRKGVVCLSAVPLAEELEFDEDAQAEYLAGITLDFVFGVDHEAGGNEFFLEINELAVDLDITAMAPNGDIGVGASPVLLQVMDGTLDLDARVSVQFDETISGDGRITLAELRTITSDTLEDLVYLIPTGTLFAELQVKADQGDSDSPVTHIYVRSENPFSETSLEVSARTDISTLKDPLLEIFKELKEVGENLCLFEQLNVSFPVIDSSINQLLSNNNSDAGFGSFSDFYTPALAYFTLLQAFNFDINDYLSEIGTMPGIDIPDFDIHQDAHRTTLKNLVETEYNLTLDQDWDFSLYLAEIWSLFNPDFEINDYLPEFQVLLGLPYVPKMDEVRSDIKALLGKFPSIEGLIDYVRTTSLTDLFYDFQGGFSQDSFNLTGQYDPASTELNIDFLADGIKEMEVEVSLESLFPNRFQDLGISFDSDLAFTLTLGLNLDVSAALSGEEVSLTLRAASATVRVNEEIDGLGVTVENLPNANLEVSEGRFDFDSRVELIFHGLDPPTVGTLTLSDLQNTTAMDSLFDIQASGTFSIELPVTDSTQTHFIIYAGSDNVFDPMKLELEIEHNTVSPFEFSLSSDVPTDVTLLIDGDDLVIVDNPTGQQLESRILNWTDEIVIWGLDDLNDTLTVDFTGGLFDVPITFHGGDAGFDTLVMNGGVFDHAEYVASGPDSGVITLDDTVIVYTGLEPITDNTVIMGSRIFYDTTSNDGQQIRLTNHTDAGWVTIDSNGT
ncbi:LEPR-XLL domain-containing protein, partial [Thermodesulfobacteriota bacterium]